MMMHVPKINSNKKDHTSNHHSSRLSSLVAMVWQRIQSPYYVLLQTGGNCRKLLLLTTWKGVVVSLVLCCIASIVAYKCYDFSKRIIRQYDWSTEVYSYWGTHTQIMYLPLPTLSAPDDLLLLFLSRSGDYLPIHLDGWTNGPSCFVTENGQEKCHTIQDCTKWNGVYCETFGEDPSLNGLDLGTLVFYRTVTPDETSSKHYTIKLKCEIPHQCEPTWAIMIALRGYINNDNPIGDSATESNDKVNQSRFPSVHGTAGDMLLLHMAFDDGRKSGVEETDFLAPDGMERINQIYGDDETGILYSQVLESSGETGPRITNGPGDDAWKDILISLIVKRRRV